ncbi:MAG: aspartate kinase, partial [Candidatus Melainabacteria bacterium]|nr:aspartate kinase [Candidatus Melainabacteria bacterium]
FGGTSVADAQCIHKAAEIAVAASSEGHEVVAVVSAMGHTTDHLISLAEQITPEPHPRELDMLLVTGEQVSIALMSMAIQSLGGYSRSFTGAQAGIITEDRHGVARIKEVKPTNIESCLGRGEIAVVAGFQGVTESNEITTLGRGGSDTTAVAMAAALGAERCDIYTDVLGVYTADPHLLSDARRLPSVSYEEMLELAVSGAQVMNARSVELAMDMHVPVRVRSSFQPEDVGTLITHRLLTPEYAVCGVACDMSQACLVLTIPATQSHMLDGVSALFVRLKELNVHTDMVILLSREDEPVQELAFTVDRNQLLKVQSTIQGLQKDLGEPKVTIDTDLARISVIGRGLTLRPGVVSSVFDTLSGASIPVQMLSVGDIRVSVLVPAKHAREAVRLLHHRFELAGAASQVD